MRREGGAEWLKRSNYEQSPNFHFPFPFAPVARSRQSRQYQMHNIQRAAQQIWVSVPLKQLIN
jgi:hypothetical protein